MAAKEILLVVTKLYNMVRQWQLDQKAREQERSVDEAMDSGDNRTIEESLGSSTVNQPTRHNLPDRQVRKEE